MGPSAICRAAPGPRGLGVAFVGTLADFPCCTWNLSRTCCHHYPGGTAGCVSRLFSCGGGLPRYYGGSASASAFSGPARCSLRVAARTACWLP